MIVDVVMCPMPPKVIGKEACLWARSPLGLSKDLGPKRRPNIEGRKSKKIQKNL